METNNKKLRILMLPWLAHGHISSFLELAKRLSLRNFHIYLCSSPINLKSIEKNTNFINSSIELIEFNLLPQPNLPPNLHTTNGLPLHLKPTLKKAMHKSSSVFSDILKNIKPDFLIYDYNQPWAAVSASSLQIPSVLFLTTCAAIMAYGSHMVKDSSVVFPYPGVGIRSGYWGRKFMEMANGSREEEEDGVEGYKEMKREEELIRKCCNLTLLKTFREIEGKYIDYASDLSGIRFVSTGPLIKSVQNHDMVDDDNDPIIRWLDTKGKSSTIFVSFGTEYYLSKEEKDEIAHGLELSMTNFIWVLKPSCQETLPKGYLNRVKERCMIIEGWAPQARILSHQSIGAFVTHCGWGSTTEAMGYGVPIVAIPMHLDQPFNAQVAVEVGVGLEAKRDENGVLDREDIARIIREIVVDEKGERIRMKAREVMEIIQRKGDDDVDVVVLELLKLLDP